VRLYFRNHTLAPEHYQRNSHDALPTGVLEGSVTLTAAILTDRTHGLSAWRVASQNAKLCCLPTESFLKLPYPLCSYTRDMAASESSKAGVLGLCELRIESDRLFDRTSDRFVFVTVLQRSEW